MEVATDSRLDRSLTSSVEPPVTLTDRTDTLSSAKRLKSLSQSLSVSVMSLCFQTDTDTDRPVCLVSLLSVVSLSVRTDTNSDTRPRPRALIYLTQ